MNDRQLIATAARLPERDLNVLEALHEHRFLTSRHITTLYFHDHTDPQTGVVVATRTRRVAHRRLAGLRHAGLILRSTLRRPDGSREAEPYYCLTLDGARVVAWRQQLPVRAARHHTGDLLAGPLFVRHGLAGGDLACALATAARTHEDHDSPPGWWQGEHAASHTFTHRGQTLLLCPDGYTRYQAGTRLHHLLVEIDLGTMTTQRLEAKLDRYRAYARSGAWHDRYPVFPKLLLLTTTHSRITTLHQRLGDVPEYPLLTTTHADLADHGPLTAIWQQPGHPDPRTLLAETRP